MPASPRASPTAPVRERLTEDVRRLYLTDYAKTWDDFLNDVKLIRPADLQQTIEVARILSAIDSPLPQFLRAASRETTLVKPEGEKELSRQGDGQAGARGAQPSRQHLRLGHHCKDCRGAEGTGRVHRRQALRIAAPLRDEQRPGTAGAGRRRHGSGCRTARHAQRSRHRDQGQDDPARLGRAEQSEGPGAEHARTLALGIAESVGNQRAAGGRCTGRQHQRGYRLAGRRILPPGHCRALSDRPLGHPRRHPGRLRHPVRPGRQDGRLLPAQSRATG